MKTGRRRTRSSSDSANNNANDIEEGESVQKDTDILFGQYNFLESHPGTKEWASIVGSYSHQYYWSSTLYQKIRNDKRLAGRRYFVFLKKNKFRPATELEIEQRTCGIFDNGGGKKKQSRKRRSSNSDVNTTDTAMDGIEGRKFQVNDSVYVYDQLWRGKIVEVGDFLDGVKFKVHFTGFLATSDQWVDRVQMFPYSEKMKEIYHQIDKAEGTAFQGDIVETKGEEDDEEDEDALSPKKRRKSQAKERIGSASSQNSGGTAPTATNPRRCGSSSNTTSATGVLETSDDSNVISASDYNDVTRLASYGSSETISHRLFSLKPKSKSALNKCTTVNENRVATTEVTSSAATSIVATSTLDLSQVLTDALKKCETAKQKAQESGMIAVVPLLNAEAAKWSSGAINRFLNVGEIQTNLPPLGAMQSDVDKWKQEGGIKGLEAMAMERNIQKWNKAQEYLARFVECLVEDL